MIYLSERRRVEAAILPRLLLGIVNDGGYRATDEAGNVIENGADDLLASLKDNLTEACIEALAGLSDPAAIKVSRRIDKLATAIFDEWRGQPAAKYGIAVMSLIRDLHESGTLMIVDGSHMHKAYDAVAPMLDDALEEERLAAAGEKKGRQLLRDLQRLGLFT